MQIINKVVLALFLITFLLPINIFAQESNTEDSYSIIFLIDVSASMKGNKIISAQKAASQMLEVYSSYNTEYAVMAYSGTCSLPINFRIGFTQDTSTIRSFISKLSTNNSTPLASAYRTAAEYMQSNSKKGTRKIIVILGDGGDDCGTLDNVLLDLQNKDMLFQTVSAGLEADKNAMKDLQNISNLTGGYYTDANPASMIEVEMSKTYLMPLIHDIIGYSRKAPEMLSYGNYSKDNLISSFKNAVFKLDSLSYFIHPDNYWGMKITVRDVPYIFNFSNNEFMYYVPDLREWISGSCEISENQIIIKAALEEENVDTNYQCRVKYISHTRMELCLQKYDGGTYYCKPKIGSDDSAFILYFTRIR